MVSIDDQPWFVAADVYKAIALPLGSQNYHMKQLGDEEKGYESIATPGGAQRLRIISESGLYKLIMRSEKPQAKDFQDL